MTFDLNTLALVNQYGYTRTEIVDQASMDESLDDVSVDDELVDKLNATNSAKKQMKVVDDFLDKHPRLFDAQFVRPFGKAYVADVNVLLAYIDQTDTAVADANERARQAEEQLAKSEENVKVTTALNTATMAELETLKSAINANAKHASDMVDSVVKVDAEFRDTQHTFSGLAQALVKGGTELESLRGRLAEFLKADEERSSEFNQIAAELDGTLSYMLDCFEKLGLLKEFFGFDTVKALYQSVEPKEA